MKVYIAGPISGDPEYRKKFGAVAELYRTAREVVILNPAELPEGLTRAEYMSICLPMLLAADRVVFLPGWTESGGARVEQALAEYCAKPIRYLGAQELADVLEVFGRDEREA